MKNVLALILGGGRGTRLHPLTAERSKPAVPLAGKYRLIDIPISNCLTSGVHRVFVLTQFLAESLNHHISMSYRFDSFREGFVSILAAEQTAFEGEDWFAGTADAVRKVLRHTQRYRFDEYLVLSGDHIYRMDYSKLVAEHRARGADITAAAMEVDRSMVPELGVMEIDAAGDVTRFVEKPKEEAVIDTLEISPSYFQARGEDVREGLFLANMGIYLFRRQVLDQLLLDTLPHAKDFGKEVLPFSVASNLCIQAHRFAGYWEDIGTIKAFFDANLAFTDAHPVFSFFDENQRIFTRPRNLPPNKVYGSTLDRVMLAQGCVVWQSELNHVVVGVRSRIGAGAKLHDTVLMGSDFFENDADRAENRRLGRPNIGIGAGATIRRAIVDKNARVGRAVVLVGGNKEDCSGEGWTLRDSVLVVHKNAIIPDGTVLSFR